MKQLVLGFICLMLASCNTQQKKPSEPDVQKNETIVYKGVAVNVQSIAPLQFQKQIISNVLLRLPKKVNCVLKKNALLAKINAKSKHNAYFFYGFFFVFFKYSI